MTESMDDHAPQSQKPYPPDAVGNERKLLQLAALTGIALIAAAIATMGLSMYLLPGAPPQLPLPLF
jgi:isopropylmalate/homocitrate/citramalate synthase